jgi:hypothetical protein
LFLSPADDRKLHSWLANAEVFLETLYKANYGAVDEIEAECRNRNRKKAINVGHNLSLKSISIASVMVKSARAAGKTGHQIE